MLHQHFISSVLLYSQVQSMYSTLYCIVLYCTVLTQTPEHYIYWHADITHHHHHHQEHHQAGLHPPLTWVYAGLLARVSWPAWVAAEETRWRVLHGHRGLPHDLQGCGHDGCLQGGYAC